ncbi:MAG: hypothetical protein M0Q94_10715 [Candidatus Cloacimonetes bacterium]|nr:hypothetical protein [Candidatus Cloacimonadota bacterium]
MCISFSEIDERSIVIVLKDVYIQSWDMHRDTSFYNSLYSFEIQEYDEEKRLSKQVIFENMYWDNWLLSIELFKAFKDNESQELNVDTGSHDNSFGLSVIATGFYFKLFFEIGTQVNCYYPFPYGTSFYQDICPDDLLKISLEVFRMELIGLKKCYLEQLDDNITDKVITQKKLELLESYIAQYANVEAKDFSHPGDIVYFINQEVKKY